METAKAVAIFTAAMLTMVFVLPIFWWRASNDADTK